MPVPDRRVLAGVLLLLTAVAAIYGHTARNRFLIYDDPTSITANPIVLSGFTWAGVRAAFGFHAGNWHPLTWLSHMLDCDLFGLQPGGHHFVNAAWNAVLKEALGIDADHCNAPYTIGTAFFLLRRYPEALARYQDSLRCYERHQESLGFTADNHFNLGNTYLLHGKPAGAKGHFRRLLHLQPADPGGMSGLEQARKARR